MRKVIGWGIALIGLGALLGFISRLLWPHEGWQALPGQSQGESGGDIDPQAYPRG